MVVVAYLAAVYLVWDARRIGDDALVEYFRRRAVVASVVAGLVAFAGIFVLYNDARYIFDGLTSPRASAGDRLGPVRDRIAGAARPRVRTAARVCAVGTVATVVAGWVSRSGRTCCPRRSRSGRPRHRPAR